VSQENVEVVRRAYAHFQATGDLLDELLAADLEWDMSKFGGWPEQQLYRGAGGARVFIGQWVAPWDDYQLEIDALHDVGDVVVAVARQRTRSKATGMVITDQFAQVWTLRDGVAVRIEAYHDVDEALKAADLKE